MLQGREFVLVCTRAWTDICVYVCLVCLGERELTCVDRDGRPVRCTPAFSCVCMCVCVFGVVCI